MPFRDAWLVVGILLVFVGYGAGEPAIIAVGFVVILIGGGTRFWSRHLFDRVDFKRTLDERRVFLGESTNLRVTLANRKFLPLPWYEWRLAIADTFLADGEVLSAAAVPGSSWLVRRGALGWYQHHDWTFRLEARERGYHLIGPGSLKSADILGVFPQTKTDEDGEHLVVFPRVLSMEDFGLDSDRPMGERKGRNRLFEDPLRLAGLREYRPGDPLKRIDWKATARSGELQSRLYEPSATQQLYLLVNIDTLAHSWEGYLKDDLEQTISVSASVAVWASEHRFAVGILANGSFPEADRPIRLPPSRSRDQLTRVLEALAVIQPLTMGDLAQSVRRESGRMPSGSTIVLVASFIPPELAAVVNRLAAEGHRVSALVTSERADTSLLFGVPVFTAARSAAWAGAER